MSTNNSYGKIVEGTQELLSSPDLEECMSYIRSDGLRISFCLTYVDDNGPAVGSIASWTPDQYHRTGEPGDCVDLNREELRYLRAFLNRPEVAHMLDAQLDGSEDTRIPVTQKPTAWA